MMRRAGLLGVLLAAACSTNEANTSDAPGSGDLGGGEAGVVCTRRVLEGEAVNARDIGGWALAGGGTVACAQIFRGGDLCSLDSAGCSELNSLGIRSVLDLRQSATQQAQPAAACVASQATLVSAPMPKLLPDTPANYLALLQEKAAVAQVFATLGNAASYPVYFHCVIGRDRASFVAALVLLGLGASRQTVIDEFELSAAAGVAVKTPCIEALLDEIDKLGGIETYLTSAGVTQAQLATLRSQARAP